MSELPEGLYDQLLTRQLREFLERYHASGGQSLRFPLTRDTAPGYLARHLARELSIVLRGFRADSKAEELCDRANRILAQFADDQSSQVDQENPEVLQALYRSARPPQAPAHPLASTHLILNAPGEAKLGLELEREMASCDEVLMIVSFLQYRGWQRLRPAFEELALRQVPVRILTTTYIGATDYGALEKLASLENVQLKISLDGSRRRLHAKAWLFHRNNGFSSVYVGSANLSAPALEDGIEWTVKVPEAESPHVVERFRGAFESYWCNEEFERFDLKNPAMVSQVREALQQAKGPKDRATVLMDVRPHPYQSATLERLEAERLDHGCFRNLVVAPTGTGKTMVAAFDYRRQPRGRLLFLAHREELLKQAREKFRHVLRDGSFGSLLIGGESPDSYDYLFATIQSFRSRRAAGTSWGGLLGLCRARRGASRAGGDLPRHPRQAATQNSVGAHCDAGAHGRAGCPVMVWGPDCR